MSAVDLGQYHATFIKQIEASLVQNRLAHGILLNNVDHLPLDPLLAKLAAILLKQEMIADLSASPDVYYLQSDDGQIKLDQIKTLLEGIYLTSHGATAKVIIISPLEALNTSAANALLKSLEEPPENTYFVMTSNYLQWIMPTLRSRVQVFDLALTLEQKKDYLHQKYQMNDGDIAKALQVSKSNLSIVDQIKADKAFWQLRKELTQVLNGERSALALSVDINNHYQDALYWLINILIDAYYYQVTGIKSALNQDQVALIEKLIARYDHIAMYGYYQRLLKLKAYEGKHFNVNKQLAIESFLIELSV